uniref:NADH dehydrogenase subunit 6 n=1 Tax=Lepidotrigona terminata TaxID=398115 RepID=A0A6B9MTS1_9HYME|nr:NADH dehydrogenase subunit 6 [Lepidotrigona terminata]
MKNIIYFYFAFSTISFSLVFMFLSVYMFNIYSNPMGYLVFVILFATSMSLMVFTQKPHLAIYIYMILMIMVSGMMVMLSYFVSMINVVKNVSQKMSLMFALVYFSMFLVFYNTYKINKPILMKNFSVIHENYFCSATKMFVYPNYYIFLMIILFMFLMLLVCSKMCASKSGTLRGKKF